MDIEIFSNGSACIKDQQIIKTLCEENSCTIPNEKLTDLRVQNPVNEALQFSFIILADKAVRYNIYNSNEQLIKKGRVASNKGFNSKIINLPEAQRGFYFLQIEDGQTKKAVKILKL